MTTVYLSWSTSSGSFAFERYCLELNAVGWRSKTDCWTRYPCHFEIRDRRQSPILCSIGIDWAVSRALDPQSCSCTLHIRKCANSHRQWPLECLAIARDSGSRVAPSLSNALNYYEHVDRDRAYLQNTWPCLILINYSMMRAVRGHRHLGTSPSSLGNPDYPVLASIQSDYCFLGWLVSVDSNFRHLDSCGHANRCSVFGSSVDLFRPRTAMADNLPNLSSASIQSQNSF